MPGPFCFAWAGGTIVEQTTLVTNGTTHGASFETRALVGDVTAGESQLFNLASTSGLEEDGYYEISGSGVAAGTRFTYDNTILSGLPGSVNLSLSAISTATSATFTATKAVAVGTVLGTLTDGSAAVSLTDTGDLPAGAYSVYGTGIGETDVPIGTADGTSTTTGGGSMIVSTCLLAYDGAGGGSLSILAATPHTTTGEDEFGQATTVTTYTVASQPVRAVSSGTYPLALSGFPLSDPTSVTDIPATVLGSLEPGLVYNIAGNGIPVGTTFVAPLSGTSITIDLPATASDLDAILTITGPRTPNAPFDPLVHNVFDEDVLSIAIEQEEGGFATLTVDIKNPNIGLLAVGRNLWCWLSWDRGWPDAPDLVPLFGGRLVGVPRLQAGEVVQLQFLARPDDLNVQKAALAESLMVLPYYDPIWITANATADTVLETYSALWHTDRTALTMAVSDILEGEDGIVEIGEDVSIYDRFSLSYGQPPLVAVTVSGTVSWDQQGEGVLDVTQTLLDAFYAAGSGYKRVLSGGSSKTKREYNTLAAYWAIGHRSMSKSQAGWSTGGGGLIQTLGDGGVASAWPTPGTTIGGGWSLSNLSDMDGVPLCYLIEATSDKGGWLKPLRYTLTYSAPITDEDADTTSSVALVTTDYGTFTMDFPVNAYKIRMNLEYRANRKRGETVTAVVAAGVQQELSDSAEADRESISLTSQYVAEGVDPDGALPIGDVAYRSYFQTARGASSFEYLLLAARAKMRARARAVDITFAVPWATALPITLRHSVRYVDRRVPGGEATGKVKSYKLTVADGVMSGEFVIGCAIGDGTTTEAQAGVNSYVEDAYVDDWQAVDGAQTTVVSSDIAYQTLDDFVIADDGLDLTGITAARVVNVCVVTNGLTAQLEALDKFQGEFYPADGDPAATINAMKTSVLLDLVPVSGGEFHTAFYPAVTPLSLPMTIDLTAPGA